MAAVTLRSDPLSPIAKSIAVETAKRLLLSPGICRNRQAEV